jgi:hypothetical protein
MTVRLATITALVAITLAGCGGDDDDATSAERPVGGEAAAVYDEISDLPDEEQIERVGGAWAEPFAKGDEEMCAYLHPDLAPSCVEAGYLDGALTGSLELQSSYAGARVESVEIEDGSAVTKFSNGEQVEFQLDSNDQWKVTSVSRAG